MKRKTIVKNVPKTFYVYISSDGKQFDDPYDCYQYDLELNKDGKKVLDTYKPLRDLEDEHSGNLYYLTDCSDFLFLVNYLTEGKVANISIYNDDLEYFNNIKEGKRKGWAYIIRYDGGDYDDTFEMYNPLSYIKAKEDELKLFKTKMATRIS